MALPNNPTAAELVKEVKSLATTKQNALTAGDNITISNDTISASTGLKQINNSIGYIQYSYYTDFTTTSEYVGYYIKDGVYYIEVTSENKDSLSIVAGTTAAYLQGNAATSVSHNNISATLYKGDYFIDANNVENALSSTSRNPVQNKVIKAALDTKQGTLPTTTTAGQVLKSTSTAGVVEWGTGGGSSSTDVQVDSTSITSGGVANLVTINGDYNASTNKLATESDLPDMTDVVHFDPTQSSTTEQTLLDNYYTKTQTYSKTEIDTRYLHTGELTNNRTYTFGDTLSATLYLDNGGSMSSLTAITHGKPLIVAGKVFATFTNQYNAHLVVSIDNTNYELVNTNNTAADNYSFFRIITVAAGTHTIRFKILGNNPNNNQTLNVNEWDTSDYVICEF